MQGYRSKIQIEVIISTMVSEEYASFSTGCPKKALQIKSSKLDCPAFDRVLSLIFLPIILKHLKLIKCLFPMLEDQRSLVEKPNFEL